MQDAYPIRTDGLCACGCGQRLVGRRTRWATSGCSDRAFAAWAIIHGASDSVRGAVWERDRGRCAECGRVGMEWEADHILEVVNGGGACGLENLQTLCSDPCHRQKTRELVRS